jgi:hypothetical protein
MGSITPSIRSRAKDVPYQNIIKYRYVISLVINDAGMYGNRWMELMQKGKN